MMKLVAVCDALLIGLMLVMAVMALASVMSSEDGIIAYIKGMMAILVIICIRQGAEKRAKEKEKKK